MVFFTAYLTDDPETYIVESIEDFGYTLSLVATDFNLIIGNLSFENINIMATKIELCGRLKTKALEVDS